MKKVAVINDLSGFGKCSLGVALPIISSLGVQAVPVATSVFTSQTGFDYYYSTNLTDMLSQYISYWKINKASFDGLYTGFITDEKQAALINLFVDEFKTSDSLLIVDPVMADDGQVYKFFTDKLLAALKELSLKADIITPNFSESCLLAGISLEEIKKANGNKDMLLQLASTAATKLAKDNANQEIIITGIKVKTDDNKSAIYNLVYSNGEITFTSSPMVNKSFSGTGDIFASTIAGLKMKNYDTLTAVKIAQGFVAKSISDTPEDSDPREGVYFEGNLASLASLA